MEEFNYTFAQINAFSVQKIIMGEVVGVLIRRFVHNVTLHYVESVYPRTRGGRGEIFRPLRLGGSPGAILRQLIMTNNDTHT